MKLGTPDYPAKGAQVSGCTSAHVTCVPCTGRYLHRFTETSLLQLVGALYQGQPSPDYRCRLADYKLQITELQITEPTDLQNYKLQIRFQRTVNFAGVSEIVGRRGVLVAHLHKVPTVPT